MDMDFPGIEYFTSNPKGHLMEKHVKGKFPLFYSKLMGYPDNLKFSERVYWYFHNLMEKPKCPICGGVPKFISFGEGYLQYCSFKCSMQSSDRIDKIRSTTMERYGVGNASQVQEVKDRKKQTLQKHYGVDVPLQSTKIKNKQKETIRNKYGVENVSQAQEVKDRKKQTARSHYGVDHPFKSQEVKNKQKETIRNKYGVENVSQAQEVKDKFRETCMERYGVENPFQSKQFQEKSKQTIQKTYGVDHPFKSQEVKDKFRETCMEKYGVNNPFQIPEVKEKALKSIYNKVMEDHPDVIFIDNVDGMTTYTCKCTHSDCYKCQGRTFTIPSVIYNVRGYTGTELCTKLLPIDNNRISGGTLEMFVRDILGEYGVKYESNNRSILKGKELDIYIPDHNLAIECNGIYWHSLKDSMYHYMKWQECKDKGIQLITIWEDQIINHPNIIKNIILSRLGIYETRIGAGRCKLKQVPSKECIKFLSMYHLQGPVNGSVRLGLYYKDELVAVMVFGRKRTALGNKKHDSWELYRYCCKERWQVIAGAERLFSHFVKTHPGTIIESFSSNDISIGGLYQKLGFQYKGKQSYSYWYIDKNMIRYHRYKFRKDELVKQGKDPMKTEFQITDEMGLYRIYDSGQLIWEYNS